MHERWRMSGRARREAKGGGERGEGKGARRGEREQKAAGEGRVGGGIRRVTNGAPGKKERESGIGRGGETDEIQGGPRQKGKGNRERESGRERGDISGPSES